jgi:hypothetical protein
MQLLPYWPNFPAVSVVSDRDFPAVTFPALGNVKSLPLGTGRLFWPGECKKTLLALEKISRCQQRVCLSLVMQFSDGKLEQKGFFYSAALTDCPKIPALVW